MEIKIPEVGESVYEALLANWHKKDGEAVRKDDILCEIETDKITLALNAEADGILSILVPAGTMVKVGSVIGAIEVQAMAKGASPQEPTKNEVVAPAAPQAPVAPPLSPAARKLAREKSIKPETAAGTGRGGRLTADDLFRLQPVQAEAKAKVEVEEKVKPEMEPPPAARPVMPALAAGGGERVTRTHMSPIRKRIAERLLAARQQTAMLTTFNEADLGRVMELRRRHSEHLRQKHGVALGLMSFFVKASVEALREFPMVNARIEGDEIVYQHFYDIGIAIGAEKGLVVPVIRDADRLSFAVIEKAVASFVDKVKTNKLAIADLEGGTFTITNGGVYGSLLSTPILNPPQSGVLGMHTIQDRPVARDGQVVIRPMMYLALSYDHRLVDGREAVNFLKKVKEYIEEPEEMFLEG